MKDLSEMFWDASVEEMMQGYVFNADEGDYVCLVCGKRFAQGIIYPLESTLYEAGYAIAVHCQTEHSIFEYLINLEKKYTGLTDHTKTLLGLFYEGYSDSEIVKEMGGGSASTVRNHRFTLREREKQSRIFCAIMGLLGKRLTGRQKFVSIHRTATRVDERYATTEKERDEILKAYFREGPGGPLARFPKKEKKKIAILAHIAKNFVVEKKYSEKEVNEILKKIYADHVTIRRYLIEYGYMDRNRDGSQYWLKV